MKKSIISPFFRRFAIISLTALSLSVWAYPAMAEMPNIPDTPDLKGTIADENDASSDDGQGTLQNDLDETEQIDTSTITTVFSLPSVTSASTTIIDIEQGENYEQGESSTTDTSILFEDDEDTATSGEDSMLDDSQDQNGEKNPDLLILSDEPDDATSTPEASDASSTSESVINIDVDNNNGAIIDNEATASSTTGENNIVSQEDIEDTYIETGNINVYANVLNVVNTNLYNSKITELVQNFDGLSADLFLNDPGASSAELSQDLVTRICTDVECKSLSSFTLTNDNLSAVANDVDVSGDSGNNSLTAGDDVKDSIIKTGDVNAVVNVLNIVNTNLVNSRWTFASINIFGDWQGDLVLPSELYFTDYMTIGAADGAAVDLATVKKVVLDVQNSNDAALINDVSVTANTGNNSLDAVENEDGTGGDIHDSAVETGQSETAANVHNVANINLINTRWYLNLVNTLGNWSGEIYNLPDQVLMSPTPGGLSFFSATAGDDAGLYQAFTNAIASMEDATTTATSTTETDVDVNNDNLAGIINDVNVSAETGDNSVTASDIKRTKILTGNARALANIINFANTNLIGSDLQVGLVNVFGDWIGDIIFGFPDLTANIALPAGNFPREQGRTVDFELDYSNLGQSSMSGSALEWQYDPDVFAFVGTSSTFPYFQPQPGVVRFDLGKISPSGSGKINVAASTVSSLAEGSASTIYARIYGLGPETNMDNNESLLEIFATTTVASANNNGNSDGNGSGDNNGGGGSGGGGGGGSSGGGSYSSANLLRIYKSNTASGPVKAGDTISFTIIVDNDGTNTIHNIVVYDTLRGPNNQIISVRQFSLDNMAPMEEAVINYDLQITDAVADGTYTNSAYAEGLNDSLAAVRTQSTALSSFTVGLGGSSGPSGGNDGLNTGTSTPAALIEGIASSTAAAIDSPGFTKPPTIGNTTGSITNRQGLAAEPPQPFVLGADTAEAAPLSISPDWIVAEESASKPSSFYHWLNIFLICLLAAFGYATANLIKRSKKNYSLSDDVPIPQEKPEPEPELDEPIFKAKRTVTKRASMRLRKKLDL